MGHVLLENRLMPDPKKVQRILNAKANENREEARLRSAYLSYKTFSSRKKSRLSTHEFTQVEDELDGTGLSVRN